MVVEIPTNRPIARQDAPDLVYKDMNAKFNAVVNDVIERHKQGQPVHTPKHILIQLNINNLFFLHK